MQLNKASKKTRNIADETKASAPETNAAADITATPRTSRSSKTKKTETAETGSVKHHHKGTTAVTVDAGAEGARPVAASAAAAPVRSSILDPVGVVAPAIETERVSALASEAPGRRNVTHEEIAKLAYSYWIARGHAHGGAEQDWLRAEQELTLKR